MRFATASKIGFPALAALGALVVETRPDTVRENACATYKYFFGPCPDFIAEHVIGVTYFLLLTLAIAPFVVATIRHILQRQKSVGGLSVAFPNECNDDSKQTLVKRSVSPLPQGGPVKEKISLHEFFVGVHNNHDKKTIKNAKACLHHVSKPGQLIDEYLCVEDTNETSVDLDSGQTAYFRFAEGWDNSDAGMFSPQILPRKAYDDLLSSLHEKDHTRLRIVTNKRSLELLRNESYEVEIHIFGKDENVVPALFEINAKDRLEVFYRGQPKAKEQEKERAHEQSGTPPKYSERKEKIIAWRRMVTEISNQLDFNHYSAGALASDLLLKHPSYAEFDAVRRQLKSKGVVFSGPTDVYRDDYRPSNIVGTLRDIEAIEKYWKVGP